VWCCPSCNTCCFKCLSAFEKESEARENEQVSGPSGQVSEFKTEEELEEFVKPQAEVFTEHAESAPPPPEGSQSATLSHTHESAAAQPEPQESILARADAASVSSRISVDSVHYDDDGNEPPSPPKFDSVPPTEQDDTLPWSRHISKRLYIQYRSDPDSLTEDEAAQIHERLLTHRYEHLFNDTERLLWDKPDVLRDGVRQLFAFRRAIERDPAGALEEEGDKPDIDACAGQHDLLEHYLWELRIRALELTSERHRDEHDLQQVEELRLRDEIDAQQMQADSGDYNQDDYQGSHGEEHHSEFGSLQAVDAW
jgi:hypothetical protein